MVSKGMYLVAGRVSTKFGSSSLEVFVGFPFWVPFGIPFLEGSF